jgi:hypothetical protein
MMENMFVRKGLALPLLWTTGAMGIRDSFVIRCVAQFMFL